MRGKSTGFGLFGVSLKMFIPAKQNAVGSGFRSGGDQVRRIVEALIAAIHTSVELGKSLSVVRGFSSDEIAVSILSVDHLAWFIPLSRVS